MNKQEEFAVARPTLFGAEGPRRHTFSGGGNCTTLQQFALLCSDFESSILLSGGHTTPNGSADIAVNLTKSG
jgi:hypothetical protein